MFINAGRYWTGEDKLPKNSENLKILNFSQVFCLQTLTVHEKTNSKRL